MLSLVHTITSLPFALYLHNPLLILIATFLFHLLADTLLHWNIFPDQKKTYPYLTIAADVLGGLLIAWLVMNNQLFTLPVLAAIAGGNLPDILGQLWELLPTSWRQRHLAWATPFFRFHDQLQLETTNRLQGLSSQATAVALALLLIYTR